MFAAESSSPSSDHSVDLIAALVQNVVHFLLEVRSAANPDGLTLILGRVFHHDPGLWPCFDLDRDMAQQPALLQLLKNVPNIKARVTCLCRL